MIALPIATGRRTADELARIARDRSALTVMALAALGCGSALTLAGPWIVGLIVTDVQDNAGAALIPLTSVLGAAMIAAAAMTWFGRVLLARLAQHIIRQLRERVFTTVLQQPSTVLESAGTGDLISRLSNDVRALNDVVSRAVPTFLAAMFAVLLSLLGLVLLDWRLAIAAMAAVPVQMFGLRQFLRRSGPVYRKHRTVVAQRSQHTIEAVRGLDTVHALQTEQHHLRHIGRQSENAVQLELRATHIRNTFGVFLNSAEFVGLSAVLIAGYALVSSDSIAVGAASAAALYFLGLFGPMGTLLSEVDTLQDAGASMTRLVGLLTLPTPASAQPRSPHAQSGVLQAANLCFRYDNERPAIRNITLRLDPGERLAIVGASGSGKTTLARILAGVLPVDRGTLWFNEVDYTDWNAATLRANMVLLSQEPHVFHGTIADDLRLFADATDAELEAAIELVGAHWIHQLPDGINTTVGDAAHQLTPGQAQHLALVRVALSDAAVVILDEATAEAGSADAVALDHAANAAIRGRTCVIIAHRLEHVQHADRIAVMDEGTIVELGSHEDLIRQDGLYTELWNA
ncbi:ABC transporter ATP-binding protein [Curtobacterium sp. ME12]|uniref:ABC transporter ATP-binding protein n=1 Tax=Curtobacterium sp. ME12 TaxID=2744253 RepID=UPI0015F4580D|nr:ABC transporter ATP-binding protein [Curtobacterium sp. ME12]